MINWWFVRVSDSERNIFFITDIYVDVVHFPPGGCLTSFGTTFPVMRKVLLFTSCGRIVTFPAQGERHFIPREAQLFNEKNNYCWTRMKYEQRTKLGFMWGTTWTYNLDCDWMIETPGSLSWPPTWSHSHWKPLGCWHVLCSILGMNAVFFFFLGVVSFVSHKISVVSSVFSLLAADHQWKPWLINQIDCSGF